MTKLRPIIFSVFVLCGFAALGYLPGCKSSTATGSPSTSAQPAMQAPAYPARPDVAPPAFKVFHHDDTSITLVTKEDATDEEIESLIWELRNAAHSRTFDNLKISQKLVDDRKPKIWFHIYRGAKCASEKYADGPPPCGGSYHAAGDFTLGGYQNRDADDGVLIHDENHEIQLWDADKPYTANAPAS